MRAGKDTSKRAIKPSKRLSTRSIPVVVRNSTSIKEHSFHSGAMYSLHDSIPAQVLSQRNKILSIFRGNPMLPPDRTALRAVLSGGWNCSSFFATRIQKKQPLLEEASGKNIMYHKRVVRKQVNHFLLVLCFNDHQ